MVVAALVFIDSEGKRREQLIPPAIAQPDALYSLAKEVSEESLGLVSFRLGSDTCKVRLALLIEPGGILQPGGFFQCLSKSALVFTVREGKRRELLIPPTIVQPDTLYSLAKEVSEESLGLVSFRLGSQT